VRLRAAATSNGNMNLWTAADLSGYGNSPIRRSTKMKLHFDIDFCRPRPVRERTGEHSVAEIARCSSFGIWHVQRKPIARMWGMNSTNRNTGNGSKLGS